VAEASLFRLIGRFSRMVGNVTRRLVAWSLSVPLMLAGTEAAHWLAYRLVYPDSWERSQVLAQSGHGYFSLLPLLGGIAGALVVSGLFLHGRAVAQGGAGRVREVRLAQFASLPPLAFALQEHLERLIHGGTIVGVALEPTFMLGLLLQLPFAVAAYLLARFLLRVVGRVARVLGGRAGRRRRAPLWTPRPRFSLELGPVRIPALAGGHAERGPPV
jgi:hypothetical protein